MAKRWYGRASIEGRKRDYMAHPWTAAIEMGARVACLERDSDGMKGLFLFGSPDELTKIRDGLPTHKLLGIIRAKDTQP